MFALLHFVLGYNASRGNGAKKHKKHTWISLQVIKSILVHMMKKVHIDRDRTRTGNPQIRSLVPYPLGHTTLYTLIEEMIADV